MAPDLDPASPFDRDDRDERRRAVVMAMDGPWMYLEITPGRVDEKLRQLAEQTVEACAAALEIRKPRVRYFSKETREERQFINDNGEVFPGFWATSVKWGLAYKGEVWIHSELSDDADIVEVAAHETWHLARPTASEASALEFGRRIREQHEEANRGWWLST